MRADCMHPLIAWLYTRRFPGGTYFALVRCVKRPTAIIRILHKSRNRSALQVFAFVPLASNDVLYLVALWL
jgi:hypothetical protein